VFDANLHAPAKRATGFPLLFSVAILLSEAQLLLATKIPAPTKRGRATSAPPMPNQHTKGKRKLTSTEQAKPSGKEKDETNSATQKSNEASSTPGQALEDAALAGPTPEFASGRELAAAMAQKCNLVEVGSRLLKAGEVKGASVSARMFETVIEYLYGKPTPIAAVVAETPPVRIIWDIPAPARERATDPEDSQDE
jgi:hypothetical protein